MDDSPQDVYAKYLPKHRGYPLWVPQLSNTHDLPREYQQDGIQIGDLGVVDTDSGFNVLLNVRKPADHPLHARWKNNGFPTFDPICVNHQDMIVKSNAVRLSTVISSGVTRIDPPSRPSAEFEFIPSSREGAILILQEGATFHDLIPKNRFRDLAIRHGSAWYRFAVRCLERPISNHSLYLVTGFFKARSWSVASFNSAKPGDDSHRIWVTKAEEGDNTGCYNWGHTFHVEWNDGPERGPNRNVDQCVFLRGFKIALRDEIFGLVTQRVIDLVSDKELYVVIKWWRFSFLKWLLFKWRRTSGTVSNETRSIDPTHEPKLSQPFHPSDTMNRFLLGKDNAMTIAVTHDSEWIDFLEKERLSSYQLMQEIYFVHFLSENCSIDRQHGVVYVEVEGERASLYACSECSTADREHEPQGGRVAVLEISEPCGDNPPTVRVITDIRGDHLTGLGCAPIECHVLVQSGDKKLRTKDRPVRAGEVTVWDDLILLPSDSSTILRISVCAFSESTCEVEDLHTGEVTVGKLLREEFVEFLQKAEDTDESSRPSLLFNTCHKNLDDLDDSIFRPREQSLRLAKIAEQSKCWEDVVNYMKDIALLDRELTAEERNLFSVGYESLIAAHRASCDNQKLEGDVLQICEEVLDILDKHLIPSATSTEAVVFYGQMLGDYHRYASDFHVDSRRKKCMEKSLAAYEGASGIAKSGLLATHPIRLHLALNLSLLHYEVLHSIHHAIHIAENALGNARAGLEGLGERERSELTPIMRSLGDNVARWKLEDEEKDGQCGGENANETGDIASKADEVPNVEHGMGPIQVRQPPGDSRVTRALNVDYPIPIAQEKPPSNETTLDTQAKPVGADNPPLWDGLGPGLTQTGPNAITATASPSPPVIPPRSPLRPPTLLGTTPKGTVNHTARPPNIDKNDSQLNTRPSLREHFGGSLTALLAALEAETTLDYSDEIEEEDYSQDSSEPSSTDSLTLPCPVTASPTTPDQPPVMPKRVYALRELLSSERAYASDLALIRDIHIPLALGQPAPFNTNGTPSPPSLFPASGSASSSRTVSTASDSSAASSQLGPPMSRDDIRIIFGNIGDLAMLSDHFVDRLEEALDGTLDGSSGQDRVGALFLEIIPVFEPLYKRYITRHPTALTHLNALPSSPALSAYLSHTRTLASSLTHAWDLPSLLIKPVQRFVMYSPLLGAITDATPDTHGDRPALIKARERMEEVVRSVNEDRRRREVVREILGSVPVPSANGTGKPKKGNDTTQYASDNAEAVEVARLEGELQRYVAFLDRLAKDLKEWRLSMRKVLVALWQWGITFGAVLGLTPSISVLGADEPEVEGRSEAYDAFTLLLASLPGLCTNLEQELQKSFIPLLGKLNTMMEPPKKLLNAMHSLEPLHVTLLHTSARSKSRSPAPALLKASQSYLALRSALSAELPFLLRGMSKATGLAVRMIAGQQAAFYASVGERWAELWDALRVAGERLGGAEETQRCWLETWNEVDVRLSTMNVTRKDEWWAEQGGELRDPAVRADKERVGMGETNVNERPARATGPSSAVRGAATLEPGRAPNHQGLQTPSHSRSAGKSSRNSRMEEEPPVPRLKPNFSQTSGRSDNRPPTYLTDGPLPPYSPTHHTHSTNDSIALPSRPSLTFTRALYTTRAIHPCIPPTGTSYRGLPFFHLACGDSFDVLREYGHPSAHADLPLYVDDGEDCLLLVRARGKPGGGGYEAGDVGWALASFLLPVD